MKLLSHGPGSDLLTHLKEVCTVAACLQERIIMACHDAGKATLPWQAYIQREQAASPHPHAAAGGILAASLILCMNDAIPGAIETAGAPTDRTRQETLSWALIALHAGAAHHSGLKELRTDQLAGLMHIAGDEQARDFFLDRREGIASLLPEVPAAALQTAWARLQQLAPVGSPHRDAWNGQFVTLPPEAHVQAYLRARNLLGRLCLFDHLSAARQSGRQTTLPAPGEAWEAVPFQARSKRLYPEPSAPIHHLRHRLCTAFKDAMEREDAFYFIDAPTGLGKTEAMLSAAEKLLRRRQMQRIVFAVPQVSIADQIFEEYFQDHSVAQIWNYRRRETTDADPGPEEPHAAVNDAEAALREQHPFSRPYNVTTFNQVLLAMCHPDRRRCLRGAGLHDAVIIMDEFHKLPMSILPLFFRFARQFAEQANCRFILGSATPLNPHPYWDLSSSVRLPQDFSRSLYRDEAVNARRTYSSLGRFNIGELIARVEEIHRSGRENLLIVVNLVAQGSWPLQQHFRTGWNPWAQLRELDEPTDERLVICLDGLMPPILRRQLVLACKTAMKRRPVTLIATQMIEVGVDLDFDRALIDYQGIASIIQRGGRVGREGRESPCPVEVFTLVTSGQKETTSFEVLLEVEATGQQRLRTQPFPDIQRKIDLFHQKEQRFFRNWSDQTTRAPLQDSDLTDELAKLQHTCFGTAEFGDSLKSFLSVSRLGGHLGAPWENTQFIAELFDDTHQKTIIVLPDYQALSRLEKLAQLISQNQSTPEERKEYLQTVADYQLTLSPRILPELNLGKPSAILTFPEEGMAVYQFMSYVL